MSESNISKTQKISPSSIECQGDADSFFNVKNVVRHEYLPQGSTVNQIYYVEVMKRLKDAVQRKRLEMWKSGNWFFQRSIPLSTQNS